MSIVFQESTDSVQTTCPIMSYNTTMGGSYMENSTITENGTTPSLIHSLYNATTLNYTILDVSGTSIYDNETFPIIGRILLRIFQPIITDDNTKVDILPTEYILTTEYIHTSKILSSNLTPMRYFGIVILVILNIFMIFGNLISATTILKTKNLRCHVHYWFVLNLAVVDLLLAVTVIPLNTLWANTGTWVYDMVTCDIMTYGNITLSALSTYSILLIAVDKYIYITRPLHYENILSHSKVAILIFVIWVTWIVFGVVSIYGNVARDKSFDQLLEADNCTLVMAADYVIFSSIVTFFIPFSILCVTSINIACIANKHIRRISSLDMLSPSSYQWMQSASPTAYNKYKKRITLPSLDIKSTGISNASRSNSLTASNISCSSQHCSGCPYRRSGRYSRLRKTFGTLMIVVVFFVLLVAPYWFATITNVWCQCVPPWVTDDCLRIFYYMTALVNPYIYIITDRRYRQVMSKMLQKMRGKKKSSQEAVTSVIESTL